MANLQEQSVWETGIYQLETSDPVLAGPDGVDNLQGKQLANRTAYLKDRVEELASGKQPAGNAVKLSAARNITMSGDGSWNVAFDGSKDVSGQLTLRDSGVAPGSYGMVTVDAKGRVTAARQMSGDDVPAHDWNKVATGKPSTLAGYGIADGASKTDLQNAVNGLVSGAPANLNTLQELAAAVNNDPKYSATVDGKLAGKADKATTLAGYGIPARTHFIARCRRSRLGRRNATVIQARKRWLICRKSRSGNPASINWKLPTRYWLGRTASTICKASSWPTAPSI
ncbi:hypothetical protein [Chromobacterium violaceum]|uniref:hypothetical protein n=1 Tax=Chromobacterium violaceum TaxID=536 RepID=UPI0018E0746F|nr:hypothetical protein [Chromobacterium violaceum]